MLPEDVPWTTEDGTSFAALRARADALLSRIGQQIGAGLHEATAVTCLAAQAAELAAALRHLATSELAVIKLIEAGGAMERGAKPGRRRNLRLL